MLKNRHLRRLFHIRNWKLRDQIAEEIKSLIEKNQIEFAQSQN